MNNMPKFTGGGNAAPIKKKSRLGDILMTLLIIVNFFFSFVFCLEICLDSLPFEFFSGILLFTGDGCILCGVIYLIYFIVKCKQSHSPNKFDVTVAILGLLLLFFVGFVQVFFWVELIAFSHLSELLAAVSGLCGAGFIFYLVYLFARVARN